MSPTLDLLRARSPFIALVIFVAFALTDHVRDLGSQPAVCTLVEAEVGNQTSPAGGELFSWNEADRCSPPILTAVVDYDFDSASKATMRMLDNYFKTLRAHSKVEFMALSSTERRCERVKERWGEACRVYSLGGHKWSKQLIGREILAMLREMRRPVVLTDTDISVRMDPEPLLAQLACDFEVDFAGGDEDILGGHSGWNINSGLLFFAPTSVAESIATCVVDWIELVQSDVNGAFKKYVLDVVPEGARVKGKSNLNPAVATELSFDQDVVKDCGRNAVTGETDMRFSVHITQKRVAGNPNWGQHVHEDVPPPGGGTGWYDESKCRDDMRAAGVKCATTHEKGGMVALVGSPIYHAQTPMHANESVAFRHCIGKDPECLYEGR